VSWDVRDKNEEDKKKYKRLYHNRIYANRTKKKNMKNSKFKIETMIMSLNMEPFFKNFLLTNILIRYYNSYIKVLYGQMKKKKKKKEISCRINVYQ